MLDQGAQDVAADPAESVDGDTHSHESVSEPLTSLVGGGFLGPGRGSQP
jgi:hypothetical protein